MGNQISVNLHSYAKTDPAPYEHLSAVGVRWVEIPAPLPEQVDSALAALERHGLGASTLSCPCDLTRDPESMRPYLEAAQAFGVSKYFISTRAGDLPKPEAYRRLRVRAELAAEFGVTLCLETHPDLGENASEARATLLAVSHPNLRWNLDTANLYYYNAGLDAVGQARAGKDLIGTVHLKDTNGATRCWWFPALGEGVVDFAGVFRELNSAGFHGPFALELEGIQGEEATAELCRARVEKSLRHLRALGVA